MRTVTRDVTNITASGSRTLPRRRHAKLNGKVVTFTGTFVYHANGNVTRLDSHELARQVDARIRRDRRLTWNTLDAPIPEKSPEIPLVSRIEEPMGESKPSEIQTDIRRVFIKRALTPKPVANPRLNSFGVPKYSNRDLVRDKRKAYEYEDNSRDESSD